MSDALTRQDLHTEGDGIKNTLMQKMINKRDVQGSVDNARDRIIAIANSLHTDTQTLIKQANSGNDQIFRKVANLESQVVAVRQEVRTLIQIVNRLAELELRQVNRMRGDRQPTF